MLFHYKKFCEKPIFKKIIFFYDFYPYFPYIQQNIKSKNFQDFKEKLFNAIVEDQKFNIGESENYHEEYKHEEWYEYSLHFLGEEKFRERLEQLYCKPLPGNWKSVYMTLGPRLIENVPECVQIEFENVPSIAQLLYAHSQTWQKIYESKNYDIKNINYYYSMILLRGGENNLIFEPLHDS